MKLKKQGWVINMVGTPKLQTRRRLKPEQVTINWS